MRYTGNSGYPSRSPIGTVINRIGYLRHCRQTNMLVGSIGEINKLLRLEFDNPVTAAAVAVAE